MLTVETAASVTDLVELDTVTADPNVPDDGSADTTLNRLIEVASEAIAEYLEYSPWRQTYTETLGGDGTPMLILSRMPIQSVTSVKISGDLITDYSIEDANAGILWRDAGWPRVALKGLPIGYDPVGVGNDKNVSVEYVAGWLLPGEASRDLPASIEQAALETVVVWYGKSGAAASSATAGPVESVRMGDTAFSYASGGGGSAVSPGVAAYAIPSRALSLLHPYRRAA